MWPTRDTQLFLPSLGKSCLGAKNQYSKTLYSKLKNSFFFFEQKKKKKKIFRAHRKFFFDFKIWKDLSTQQITPNHQSLLCPYCKQQMRYSNFAQFSFFHLLFFLFTCTRKMIKNIHVQIFHSPWFLVKLLSKSFKLDSLSKGNWFHFFFWEKLSSQHDVKKKKIFRLANNPSGNPWRTLRPSFLWMARDSPKSIANRPEY